MNPLNSQRAVHESRVVALPAEVLSIIFELACTHSATCPPFPESFPIYQHKEKRRWVPLDLGTVCSCWRQLSLSMPSLWTSLSLEIPSRITTIGTKSITSTLLLYIRNSGALPLSLELVFKEFPIILATSTLGPIREVIFQQYAWKIKALQLVSPPKEWLPESNDFSQLEDFSVGWPSESLFDRKYDNMPLREIITLRRFSLHHMSSLDPKVQLRGPNITDLHLSHFYFDRCVDLLFGCPNLVSYQCFFPIGILSLNSRRPIILPKLEVLAWPCCGLDGNDGPYRIFAMLRLPSLKKLHLNGLRSGHHILGNFFLSISPSLRTLELSFMDSTSKDKSFYETTLDTLSELTELTLSTSCFCVLNYICTSLTPSASGGIMRLPNLQILRCRNIGLWTVHTIIDAANQKICDFDSEVVSKMLERRKKDWGAPLRFEVLDHCSFRWEGKD